jgi:hypothetical protein
MKIKFLSCIPMCFRARKDGNYFEDQPQRDIEFADSISVLRIQEVHRGSKFTENNDFKYSREVTSLVHCELPFINILMIPSQGNYLKSFGELSRILSLKLGTFLCLLLDPVCVYPL